MSHYHNQIITTLTIYSRLYLLLGVIELTLREVIPTTLSVSPKEKTGVSWLDILKRDKFRAREIEALEIENFDNIAERLSFGFWCRVFVPHNYSKVWLAGLHDAFPNTDSRKSRHSYLQICNCFKRASRIRNQVAHFQVIRDTSNKRDEAVLNDLIQSLGVSDLLVKTERII